MPKDETFRHITCESVTVVNGKDSEIRLSFDDIGWPRIEIKKNKKSSVVISVDEYGGVIYVKASDGFTQIHAGVDCNYQGYVLTECSRLIPPR